MKRVFVLITLAVVLVAAAFPTQAFAASAGLNSSLVTNVKQSGENMISFKVNAPATYIVYRYFGARPSHGRYFGNMYGDPVATGTVSKACTVKVEVPLMGNYYITTTSRFQYDDDYVGVKSSITVYSGKFKWTPQAITDYYLGKAASAATSAVVTNCISILCPPCRATIVVVKWVARGVKAGIAIQSYFVERDSYRNIAEKPKKNYSWQYKYVPSNDGYTAYLLVFDEKDRLKAEYEMGSVIIIK